MTDPHRSPEYQQLARRFLETSETQHTRSFAASCDPDTAAAVPHEFIDWALVEFRNNRWGAVEPHMVVLNGEILDLHFGDADRRAEVAQALADSIGVFGNRRRDLPDSELATAIENLGEEASQRIHGEYPYGEPGDPTSVRVWIDQQAPDGDIRISSPNLSRKAGSASMPEDHGLVMEIQYPKNADGSMGNRQVLHPGAPEDAIYARCLDASGTPLPGDDSWYDPARWYDSPHAMHSLADLIVASHATGVRLRLRPMPTVAALKRAFKAADHIWRGSYVGWLNEFSV